MTANSWRARAIAAAGVSECVVAFMTGTFVLHMIRRRLGDRPTRDCSLGRGLGVAVGFFGGNALIVVELLRPVRPRRCFGTGDMRLHTRHEMARPRLIER
jgi:hypothetical protein